MDYAKSASENRLFSFDFETHKIQPGLLAPPIVCGAWCSMFQEPQLSDKKTSVEVLRKYLLSDHVIVGANIAYDLVCAAVEEPDLLPLICDKLDHGEVFDVLLAQYLDSIYHGYLRDETGKKMLVDPRTGSAVKDPHTGKITNRYNLSVVTDLVLGRVNAKDNDRWRLSYALLENTPIEQWDADAQQYPKDDVTNALEVALAQIAGHKNLHDMPKQAWAAFAMQLGSVWGIRADPAWTAELKKKVEEKHAGAMKEFADAGFLGADGKENQKTIKGSVLSAFGGGGAPCGTCRRLGKVTSPKSGNLVNCKECDGTGYDISRAPRTEKGSIKKDRDTLSESGDDLLEAYAKYGPNNKIRQTYLPFLEEACRTPMNLSPNVLLSTGRTSYDGLIQLLPREGGVRECIIPSKGMVFCSVDYSAIEMCTLGFVCEKLVGFSKILETINATKDPGRLHTDFAAKMANRVGDALFYAQAKIKGTPEENLRFMAKAGNFGYPGMMGPVKFAQAKRKEGIRLCLKAGWAEKCGVEKITEWNGFTYTPTCKRCVEVGAWLKDEYTGMWGEIKPYWKIIQSLLAADDGRITQLVSERVRGGCSAPAAANTLFQGLAADGAKRALRLITREAYCDRRSPLYGSRLVAFAHDETFMEHREDVSHEAAHRQAELMVQGMHEVIPNVCVVAEPALMRRWYKKAEPVYENGRLVPWEPKEARSA